MTKNLFYPKLWGILALSLLFSCRTEEGVSKQNQEAKYFSVFVPKSGEKINYANGFAFLMKRYDELHKTNLSGINNNLVLRNLSASTSKNASVFQNTGVYVEFAVRSQTITEENGDKWVVFPKVEGNKVVSLVAAVLSQKETYVSYHTINEGDELYKRNISRFQEALVRYQKQRVTLALNASINPMAGSGCSNNGVEYDNCGIPEVVIDVPPKSGGGTSYPGGGGSGCLPYELCSPGVPEGSGTGTPQQDPCNQIKSSFTNDKFKAKFQKLTNPDIFKLDHEMGSFERYPPKENVGIAPAFADVENYVGTTDMDLPSDKGGIVGLMHSHNNEDKNGNKPVKIFSPTDVRTFLNILMTQANNYTGSYQNAYSVVTTSEGNYMLKYTKDTWPTPADGGKYDLDRRDKWNAWYEREYKKLIDDDALTQENVEKIFTKFLKEAVKVDGLEVYKVTETSSSKMEYNGANNPVKSTPC